MCNRSQMQFDSIRFIRRNYVVYMYMGEKKTAIISLQSINRLLLTTEAQCFLYGTS